MALVKIQSSDGRVFEVDKKTLLCSKTMKFMFSVVGEEEEENDDPVPVPNVSAAILEKIIEWCEYHKNDPPPKEKDANAAKRTDDICPWDVEFLKVGQTVLFEIILAANYLDIELLLDNACKTVANMMRGKSPEEIRRTFNIKNDFEAEEGERLIRETYWCTKRYLRYYHRFSFTTEIPGGNGFSYS